MRRNRLRERLNADEPSLGTHLHCSWPGMVELVGQSKMFDYVEFVGEYAPYDLYELENIGRAVELFEMSSMMKVEQMKQKVLMIPIVLQVIFIIIQLVLQYQQDLVYQQLQNHKHL